MGLSPAEPTGNTTSARQMLRVPGGSPIRRPKPTDPCHPESTP
jgi:hypothetical protein